MNQLGSWCGWRIFCRHHLNSSHEKRPWRWPWLSVKRVCSFLKKEPKRTKCPINGWFVAWWTNMLANTIKKREIPGLRLLVTFGVAEYVFVGFRFAQSWGCFHLAFSESLVRKFAWNQLKPLWRARLFFWPRICPWDQGWLNRLFNRLFWTG